MTTLDLYSAEATGSRVSLFTPFRKFIAGMKQRRLERRTMQVLSTMDARTLRDIGIEPQDVYDANLGRRLSVLLNPMRRPSDHQ
jgi:uncharacterized protein YjiS (DUF1127 family)